MVLFFLQGIAVHRGVVRGDLHDHRLELHDVDTRDRRGVGDPEDGTVTRRVAGEKRCISISTE